MVLGRAGLESRRAKRIRTHRTDVLIIDRHPRPATPAVSAWLLGSRRDARPSLSITALDTLPFVPPRS